MDELQKRVAAIGERIEDLEKKFMPEKSEVDRSDAADANRFRWLLSGNGYFMEEQMLCGHGSCSLSEQDDARREIDEAMNSKTQS